MQQQNKIRILSLLLAIVFLSMARLPASESTPRSKGQTVYAPVYSHIYVGDAETRFLLAVTLSIRNTDPKHSVTLVSVDYFDSNGKLIQRYLDSPTNLKKLSTLRYVVKESDSAGGSGANFLVTWKAKEPVSPPLIETVMIGTRNQQGISFTSRGVIVPGDGDR